jgi:hypothetical protein
VRKFQIQSQLSRDSEAADAEDIAKLWQEHCNVQKSHKPEGAESGELRFIVLFRFNPFTVPIESKIN